MNQCEDNITSLPGFSDRFTRTESTKAAEALLDDKCEQQDQDYASMAELTSRCVIRVYEFDCGYLLIKLYFLYSILIYHPTVMAPQEEDQSRIIRVNVIDYLWEEVDVVHAPGYVTRYTLWKEADGKLTGQIKHITPQSISTRTITDQDILDLGLLAVRTQWGLRNKKSDS